MRILAGAALVLGMAWAQGYERSPGYAAYREANALFVAKKMPEALQALERSLGQDEKLVPALTLYAKIAMTMNRYDAARESLDRALAVEPKSANVRFLYGLSYFLSNDLQHALPEFVKAREADAKDPRTPLYLGLTYESLGRTQEAMRLYEESARLGPSVETDLAGARLLQLLGRVEEGEVWVRKALAMAPGSRDAHFEMARVLLRLGKAAEAAKEGERALALGGGEVSEKQIHYLLIRAYRESQPGLAERHAAAVRALESASGKE
jgi:tetratricopeptide (TPR) repeat protein